MAGKGGFTRGSPRRPSSELSSPVSSPQMYAPAPRCRVTSMSTPLPITLRPAYPAAYASSMALARTCAGSKNSPRM